jgi:hypothetical protein
LHARPSDRPGTSDPRCDTATRCPSGPGGWPISSRTPLLPSVARTERGAKVSDMSMTVRPIATGIHCHKCTRHPQIPHVTPKLRRPSLGTRSKSSRKDPLMGSGRTCLKPEPWEWRIFTSDNRFRTSCTLCRGGTGGAVETSRSHAEGAMRSSCRRAPCRLRGRQEAYPPSCSNRLCNCNLSPVARL